GQTDIGVLAQPEPERQRREHRRRDVLVDRQRFLQCNPKRIPCFFGISFLNSSVYFQKPAIRAAERRCVFTSAKRWNSDGNELKRVRAAWHASVSSSGVINFGTNAALLKR